MFLTNSDKATIKTALKAYVQGLSVSTMFGSIQVGQYVTDDELNGITQHVVDALNKAHPVVPPTPAPAPSPNPPSTAT